MVILGMNKFSIKVPKKDQFIVEVTLFDMIPMILYFPSLLL